LDIAIEQLRDALDKYVEGHFYSAIVLAGAAEQLLAGHLLKDGLTPSFSQERAAATKIANGLKGLDGSGSVTSTEKEVGNLMNRAYNSSKHAGKDDHLVRMDPQAAALEVIDRAISNYDLLSTRPDYELPDLPLAQQLKEEYANQARFL
jgi:hypothetical protein